MEISLSESVKDVVEGNKEPYDLSEIRAKGIASSLGYHVRQARECLNEYIEDVETGLWSSELTSDKQRLEYLIKKIKFTQKTWLYGE